MVDGALLTPRAAGQARRARWRFALNPRATALTPRAPALCSDSARRRRKRPGLAGRVASSQAPGPGRPRRVGASGGARKQARVGLALRVGCIRPTT